MSFENFQVVDLLLHLVCPVSSWLHVHPWTSAHLISSHGPVKTSSHLAVHIHVSPVLTRVYCEEPREWCPLFRSSPPPRWVERGIWSSGRLKGGVKPPFEERRVFQFPSRAAQVGWEVVRQSRQMWSGAFGAECCAERLRMLCRCCQWKSFHVTVLGKLRVTLLGPGRLVVRSDRNRGQC